MKLFDPTPTSTDLDSRGLTAALQALLGIICCFFCVGFAIESLGWISGATPEPDQVTLPGRGGSETSEYTPDTGWFIFLSSITLGVLFAAVTLALLRRAVSAFKNTSKKAKLREQQQRRALRNRRKKGSARPVTKRGRP